MRCNHCMRELPFESAAFCPFCGKNPNEKNAPHRLAAGTVLHGRYLIGNSLGEGGFGITYVGLDQTLDIKVAVKEYFPSGVANRTNTFSNEVSLNLEKYADSYQRGKEGFLREAKSIAKFSNEKGIVDVRDFFTENNTAYIVMEFLDGVDLREHVNKNGAMDAQKLFDMLLPIMRSLDKMHKANIIHRDISPDNIMLLKDGTLKLMDFGAARQFSRDDDKSLSVVIKHGFAPYEQHTSHGKQGPWTDVYALCATIYACITGNVPLSSLDRVVNDDLKKPSELGVAIPEKLENALMKGLAVIPQDRLQNMGELIIEAGGKYVQPPVEEEKQPVEKEKLPVADKTDNITVAANDLPKDSKKTVSAEAPVPPPIPPNCPPSPPYVPPMPPNGPPPAPKSKKFWIPIAAGIGMVLAAAIILTVVLINSGVSSNSKSSSGSSSKTSLNDYTETKKPTTEPTTVAPTTEEPTTVEPTTVEPTTVKPTTVEPTTKKPPVTTAPPETTVKPTESFYETRTYTDDSISIQVPKHWLDSYYGYDYGNELIFYEPTNNALGSDGMGKLFGIFVFNNANSCNNFLQGAPRSRLLTTSGGKFYVLYRPTDVQYTSGGESAYRRELQYVDEAVDSFYIY